MKCPKCNEEMVSYGQGPQMAAENIMEQSKELPVIIRLFIYRIFVCSKCGVKISIPEVKDYFPVPDPIKNGTTCEHGGHCKKEHKLQGGVDTPDAEKPCCPCEDWIPKREKTDGELKPDAS